MPLAEPVWREALGRIELRAYAKAALAALADGDPAVASLPGLEPDDHDLAWMITDALAAEGWDDPDRRGRPRTGGSGEAAG